MLMDLLQTTQLVGGRAGAPPQGLPGVSLRPFPCCLVPHQVQRTRSTGSLCQLLEFLESAPFRGGHHDKQYLFMVFARSACPWQDWEGVVLPLVRAGPLRKTGWLGLPERRPLLLSPDKPSCLPLAGPTLTWHVGACLSPPIPPFTPAKPQPPKSHPTLPPPEASR